MNKLVIIGSGPAGWTAAIYAARANLNPIVFEGRIEPLGQLATTTEVENYPGFPYGDTRSYLKTALAEERLPDWINEKEQPTNGINGPELMELMRRQAKNFGTTIITEDVDRVDFSGKPFKVCSGNMTVNTSSVIIATGAKAKYLNLPSEEKYKNRGVSACAVCDGALPRYRNKPVAVIGGGDSAIEQASYLLKFASQVSMIIRSNKLKASRIMQNRLFRNTKIHTIYNSIVTEVVGNEKDGVTAIRLQQTALKSPFVLQCSGMFCAIGHTPNTEFLKGQLELTEHGYIKLVKPGRTNTSVEGVFAAGDVADDYYRQAVTAAGTGCMAALDAERYLASL